MTDYSELLDAGRIKRGRFARRQDESSLFMLDGLVYGLVTAGTFGWLRPC